MKTTLRNIIGASMVSIVPLGLDTLTPFPSLAASIGATTPATAGMLRVNPAVTPTAPKTTTPVLTPNPASPQQGVTAKVGPSLTPPQPQGSGLVGARPSLTPPPGSATTARLALPTNPVTAPQVTPLAIVRASPPAASVTTGVVPGFPPASTRFLGSNPSLTPTPAPSQAPGPAVAGAGVTPPIGSGAAGSITPPTAARLTPPVVVSASPDPTPSSPALGPSHTATVRPSDMVTQDRTVGRPSDSSIHSAGGQIMGSVRNPSDFNGGGILQNPTDGLGPAPAFRNTAGAGGNSGLLARGKLGLHSETQQLQSRPAPSDGASFPSVDRGHKYSRPEELNRPVPPNGSIFAAQNPNASQTSKQPPNMTAETQAALADPGRHGNSSTHQGLEATHPRDDPGAYGTTSNRYAQSGPTVPGRDPGVYELETSVRHRPWQDAIYKSGPRLCCDFSLYLQMYCRCRG